MREGVRYRGNMGEGERGRDITRVRRGSASDKEPAHTMRPALPQIRLVLLSRRCA